MFLLSGHVVMVANVEEGGNAPIGNIAQNPKMNPSILQSEKCTYIASLEDLEPYLVL